MHQKISIDRPDTLFILLSLGILKKKCETEKYLLNMQYFEKTIFHNYDDNFFRAVHQRNHEAITLN